MQMRITSLNRARPLKKEVKDGWREVCPQAHLGKPGFQESPCQLSSQADCVLLWEPGQVLGLAGPSSSCFPDHLGPWGTWGAEPGAEEEERWGGGGSVCAPQAPQLVYTVTIGTHFCTTWQSCSHLGPQIVIAQHRLCPVYVG